MNIWGLIIGCFIVLLTVALVRAHFSDKNDLSLLDLVTRDGKLSMTRILQLTGGVVGTWIMVKTTVSGDITWDLFAIYLAYVASIEGFAKVVSAKFSSESRPTYGGYRGYGRPYDMSERDPRVGGAQKTPEDE